MTSNCVPLEEKNPSCYEEVDQLFVKLSTGGTPWVNGPYNCEKKDETTTESEKKEEPVTLKESQEPPVDTKEPMTTTSVHSVGSVPKQLTLITDLRFLFIVVAFLILLYVW